MPRGRKPNTVYKPKLCVRVTQDTMDKINLHHMDPFTGRLRYGETSDLVERLLQKHFHNLEAGPKDA